MGSALLMGRSGLISGRQRDQKIGGFGLTAQPTLALSVDLFGRHHNVGDRPGRTQSAPSSMRAASSVFSRRHGRRHRGGHRHRRTCHEKDR
ncbi:hypothetical protein CN135_24850 [Sinorhizobium meliloti]|nr:hypothetical protein CN198_26305 [Sinorhizobium meliloti]RVK63301.1 hypothetical protein CN159_28240 [Sinorhizobium meliloti]RVL75669.1 hypothetical protein CN135_24850 [Sinorhizobium meliloti]